MPAFLTDENFDRHILTGPLRRRPSLDIVRVQEVGFRTAVDNRVLLTHDASTMSVRAYERVRNGEQMPGVVVVNDALPIGAVIRGILLMLERMPDSGVEGLVHYLLTSVTE